MFPYGRQSIDEDDIQAVVDVLKGDFLTGGPKVREFEEALAQFCGAKYAVTCTNGTAALHLACLALDLGPGDLSLTTPLTFSATANATRFCGGEVGFVDIDKKTWNMDLRRLEEAMVAKKPKALFPVHYAGLPVDMERVAELAKAHGCSVVEDGCHAIGSSIGSHRTGSCTFSDLTCFSFHPVKHLACGEGGAVLTNRKDLYEKLLRFRNHGLEFDPEHFEQLDEGFTLGQPNPWYREQQGLGYNYRLTDMQCALGLSQLKKLEASVVRRRELMKGYQESLGDRVTFQEEPEGFTNAYHLCTVLIDFGALDKPRRQVMMELQKLGVGTQVIYVPVHMHPYYGGGRGDFPNAEWFYDRCLSLPLYPSLTDAQHQEVIQAVRQVLG